MVAIDTGLPGCPSPGFAVGDTVDMAAIGVGCDVIRQTLVDSGYLAAEVSRDTVMTEQGGVRIRYSVNRGVRFKVAGWELIDDHPDAPRLDRRLPRSGSVADKETVNLALTALLVSLTESGHPLAEVVPAGVLAGGDGVVVTLAISRGPEVRVEFLEFGGRSGTSSRVLARLARFRPGSRFSPALIGSWRRNLELSRVVRVEREDGLVVDAGGGYGYRFVVSERRSNRATGAIGYSPFDRRLTGLLDVRLANLFRSGRRLSAGWSAPVGRSVYRVAYHEPWVLGLWLGLGGRASVEVTDTTRSQALLAVNAELLVSPDLALTFEAGTDWVAGLDTLENARTVWAGTGVEADFRTPASGLLSGWYLRARTSGGERSSRSADAAFVGRVEADWELLMPVWRRLVVVNSLHPRVVFTTGGALPDHELCRLGGASSLRGYLEDQFVASQFAWWNAETRWYLSERSSVYPFFDLGVLWASEGWKVYSAYGVGAKIATRIGTFGIDYGVAVSENPLHGKVHLGFAGEF